MTGSTDNVSLHLKNIFADKELDEISTTEEFSTVASNGKTYQIKHYNLDAIIATGYRINTKRATAFRQWATSVLRDYVLRGYISTKNVWKMALSSMKIILNTFLPKYGKFV